MLRGSQTIAVKAAATQGDPGDFEEAIAASHKRRNPTKSLFICIAAVAIREEDVNGP